MKKVFLVLLAILICLSLFAACAEDTAKKDADISKEESTFSDIAETSDTSFEETAEESVETSAPSEDEPTEKTTVRIGGLKGPTSMGLVKLMEDNDNGNSKLNYEFTVEATADMITPKLIKGELDMVAVPANLASVLYNNTAGKVQVLALNTLGVIYIVEKNTGITSLEELRGRTIYATGKGSTPEYNLRYLLNEAGLNPDKDLTIEFKSEPAEVVAMLKNSDSGIAMLPQPYVTVAKTQVEGLNIAINLNDEWNELNNGSMMVTGVMVVRKEFAENNKSAIEAFLEEYKASTEYINENAEEASAWVEKRIGVKAPIAKQAIPYCNITFIKGGEMKTALNGYLGVLYAQNEKSIGGKMPADDFFYGA